MTEAENLARLSAAATKEADDIRYYSGGSSYNASEAKYHAELARLHRSGRLVLLSSVDEIKAAFSAGWDAQSRSSDHDGFAPYPPRRYIDALELYLCSLSDRNMLKGSPDA